LLSDVVPPYSWRMNRLTHDIDAIVANCSVHRPFSGVISVDRHGETLYARAHGWANRSERIPNRVTTRFQTASGTKTFTAAAVLCLVDEGLVSLETPVRSILPEVLPAMDDQVTLEDLLTHTSGIPDYFDEETRPPEDFEKLWWERPCYRMRSPSDFLPWMEDQPMVSPPGERFRYNNGGYVLLGILIERITGESYHEVVRSRVFRPAKMLDSGFYEADKLPERTALAYIDADDGTWRTNLFAVPSIGMPDGGAYVTAPDMVRFWDALRTGRLFRRSLADRMRSARVAASGHVSYGYGLWVYPTHCVAIGDDPGVTFSSGLFESTSITATVIGNIDNVGWQVWKKLAARLAA